MIFLQSLTSTLGHTVPQLDFLRSLTWTAVAGEAGKTCCRMAVSEGAVEVKQAGKYWMTAIPQLVVRSQQLELPGIYCCKVSRG